MDPRISRLIDSLPTLTKEDVDVHDFCPICFVDFKTILDDEVSQSEGWTAGLTRLVDCSHVFCRKDLIQWIRSWHGSCPTCRNIFLSNLRPRSESDDESDGGEYVPNEHEEYEDDDESFSFEAEPDEFHEDLEDSDAFGEAEEFEEEDDLAMGMDTEFEELYERAYVQAQAQAEEARRALDETEFQELFDRAYAQAQAQAEEEASRALDEVEFQELFDRAYAQGGEQAEEEARRPLDETEFQELFDRAYVQAEEEARRQSEESEYFVGVS